MAQREQAVANQELKLQERVERDNLRLKRELKALAYCESDLISHEATLVVEQKDLEETRARVLAHELTADIRDAHLNSRDEELADREKRLPERQLQELATTRGRLEELQAAWAGEA
jgi:uncharacterized protein (DUF3084 family)